METERAYKRTIVLKRLMVKALYIEIQVLKLLEKYPIEGCQIINGEGSKMKTMQPLTISMAVYYANHKM